MSTSSVDPNTKVLKRLSEARTRLLLSYPFYGYLLLRLDFELGDCKTAQTDMKSITFDPSFVKKLSDKEIDFVIMHEVLHCALGHCMRATGKKQYFYNIACDIVVNSIILNDICKPAIGVKEFTLKGHEVMHRAPNFEEGSRYTADEVYEMLMNKYGRFIDDVNELISHVEKVYGVIVDNHKIWEVLGVQESLSEDWRNALIEAAKSKRFYGGIPGSIEREIEGFQKNAQLDWRVLLADFIDVNCDKYDYGFNPPDRRFLCSDIIMPSFAEEIQDTVENIMFAVDASGSISAQTLNQAYGEVESAIKQFDYIKGKLAFFDVKMTEPIDFDTINGIEKRKIRAGGGTSFHCIFEYIKENMSDKLPRALIIITDGCASFPKEEMSMGIPVLWIIAGSYKRAPWGKTINIK